MKLQVRLLGGFAVQWDGQTVAFPTEKAKLLFAYLVVHEGRFFTRDQLAGLLWPESDEDKAKTNLRATLSRIKKALQAAGISQEFIEARRTQVGFQSQGNCEADVHMLEGLRKQYEQRAELQLLENAVQLYQGDFLAGFYEDWNLVEQERWRSLHNHLLNQLIEQALNHKQDAMALTYCQQALHLNALQEDIHQKLMMLHARLGDRAAALAQYERCRQLLERELGASPLPETNTLYERIKAQGEDERRLTGTLDLTSPSLRMRLETAPFVNRHTELSFLKNLWTRTQQGQGHVLLLAGEAGIGKSRLVQAFMEGLGASAVRALSGRCLPLEQRTFSPWIQAFRTSENTLVGIVNELELVWQNELAQCFPELVLSRKPSANPRLSDEAALNRRLEAFSRVVQRLANQEPLLIFLDDLHWADEPSLQLLHYLSREVQNWPVFLVGTYRQEDVVQGSLLDEVAQALIQTRLATLAELHPLNPNDLSTLSKAILKGAHAHLLKPRLVQTVGGNPFFLIETLRALIENGWQPEDINASEQLESLIFQEEFPLSNTIRSIIALRLKRLPLREQHLLQLAAVCGTTIDINLLSEAMEQPRHGTLEVLETLTQLRILSNSKDGLVFRHDLVRLVVVQGLGDIKRRYLHQRWLGVLESHPDHRRFIKALAYHAVRGNLIEKAFTYSLLAAEQASQEHAHRQALVYLNQADALLKSLRFQKQEDLLRKRFQLAAQRAAVYEILGDRDQQQVNINTLKAIAEALAESSLKAQAFLSTARIARLQGQLNLALRHIQQGLSFSSIPLALKMGFLREQELAYYALGKMDQALACAQDFLHLAQTQADLNQLRLAQLDIGILQWHKGHYQAAFDIYKQALELCRMAGDELNEGLVLINLGNAYWSIGAFSEADSCYDRGRTLLHQVGYLRGEALALVCRGVLHRDQGQHKVALHKYQEAMPLLEKIQDRYNIADLLGKLGEILRNLGDFKSSEVNFVRSIELAKELGASLLETYALSHQALLHLRMGNPEQALAHSLSAISKITYGEEALFTIEAHFHHYQILHACKRKKEALVALSKAHRVLQEQASSIQEERFRSMFLNLVPINAQVSKTWQREHATKDKKRS